MQQPNYYRTRIKAFEAALNYEIGLSKRINDKELQRNNEMRIAYLRNGHIPEKFLFNPEINYDVTIEHQQYKWIEAGKEISFPLYISEYNNSSNEELTPLEIHTLDTFFDLYPKKVCGKQKGATGFSFPVETIGTKDDIINAINETLSSKPALQPKPNLKLIKLKAKALKLKLQLA
jgi:hypothetical protein